MSMTGGFAQQVDKNFDQTRAGSEGVKNFAKAHLKQLAGWIDTLNNQGKSRDEKTTQAFEALKKQIEELETSTTGDLANRIEELKKRLVDVETLTGERHEALLDAIHKVTQPLLAELQKQKEMTSQLENLVEAQRTQLDDLTLRLKKLEEGQS